jgi:hypothetical protein
MGKSLTWCSMIDNRLWICGGNMASEYVKLQKEIFDAAETQTQQCMHRWLVSMGIDGQAG